MFSSDGELLATSLFASNNVQALTFDPDPNGYYLNFQSLPLQLEVNVPVKVRVAREDNKVFDDLIELSEQRIAIQPLIDSFFGQREMELIFTASS